MWFRGRPYWERDQNSGFKGGGGGTTGAFAKKEVIEKRIHTIKEGQEYGVKI